MSEGCNINLFTFLRSLLLLAVPAGVALFASVFLSRVLLIAMNNGHLDGEAYFITVWFASRLYAILAVAYFIGSCVLLAKKDAKGRHYILLGVGLVLAAEVLIVLWQMVRMESHVEWGRRLSAFYESVASASFIMLPTMCLLAALHVLLLKVTRIGPFSNGVNTKDLSHA